MTAVEGAAFRHFRAVWIWAEHWPCAECRPAIDAWIHETLGAIAALSAASRVGAW
jgi:hypothetical protein